MHGPSAIAEPLVGTQCSKQNKSLTSVMVNATVIIQEVMVHFKRNGQRSTFHQFQHHVLLIATRQQTAVTSCDISDTTA